MHAGEKGKRRKQTDEREMKGEWRRCRETSVLIEEEQK